MNLRFSSEVDIYGEEEIVAKASKALFYTMLKGREIAVDNVSVDRGELKNSIKIYPMLADQTEYLLTDGVKYGVHLEYGTAPHHPPIEPLKGWARRKLGDENAAWVVAKKIAKEGTDAHPFMRPAYMLMKDKWLPIYINRFMGRP